MKLIILFLLFGVNLSNTLAQDSTNLAVDTSRTHFYVRSAGPMPYMEYGPGDDRLGGAKMTYLDSNLLLKVIDSTATDYIVRLSKNHHGYILKSNTKTDSVTPDKPFYLSSSWRVYGDNKYDYITVQMDERLPYRSQHSLSPSGLTIDIFGLTSNTNWITHTGTAREIKNVWYEQPEDDVLRMHVQLKHDQHWGHYIFYDSTSRRLTIRIKRQPKKLRARGMMIAVDAGHGGANTGAMGKTTKVSEKEYTLRYASQLSKYLSRKGMKVYMTRTTDVDISMIDRALMLRAQDPDFLVSLHFNSSANAAVNGTSTYYRYIGFKPLSAAILECMLKTGLANFGNVGAFNFALSGPTEYPNALVEIAFLSNESDENRIAEEKFSRTTAKQIYRGIKLWLKTVRRQ